jgi:hypothetical protein
MGTDAARCRRVESGFAMTGQVEIRITAACLLQTEHMDAATDRAADVIYRRHPRGGPSIAGDLRAGVLSVLTAVDDEDCDAWLPQLRALCLAIEGRIDHVTVGPPR